MSNKIRPLSLTRITARPINYEIPATVNREAALQRFTELMEQLPGCWPRGAAKIVGHEIGVSWEAVLNLIATMLNREGVQISTPNYWSLIQPDAS